MREMGLGLKLCIATTAALMAGESEAQIAGDRVVVGYFPEWGVYARDYFVGDVPADLLTHINYSFARISAGGEIEIYDSFAAFDKIDPDDPQQVPGNLAQLQALKLAHPHLKTLIAVGGWTLSDGFSEAASTAQKRATFAASCVSFIRAYGFDGVDLDWEYPVSGGPAGGVPADKPNFTLLLAEIRSQLDAAGVQDGRSYLLTIATPAGPSTMANIELDQVHNHVDFINVMTYDFHGTWESTTNFNAPLYPTAADPSGGLSSPLSADAAIQAYLGQGVPADKLVLGVPFYGRGWQGVSSQNNGLYRSSSGAAPGTWEAGSFDYKDIAANYLGSYTRYWHSEAQVPWLYNASTGIFITYDDPQSLDIKSQYVIDGGLRGVMFWELSNDTSDSALLTAIYDKLSDTGPPPTNPPTAPFGLSATSVAADRINLSWSDGSSDEDGFYVERSTDGSTFVQVATAGRNATSHADTSLSPQTTYYYRVRAFSVAGASAYSNTANASTPAPPAPPPAPSGLTATAVSSSRIDLTWTDGANDEDGFHVERSLDGASWTRIASTGPNSITYSSTGLSADTEYHFRVQAFNAGGASGYSNAAAATTTSGGGTTYPTAPSDLTAVAVSSTQIDLAWTDNANNEDGFIMERAPAGSGFTDYATLPANTTSWSDTSAAPSTTYYYRVSAFNSGGRTYASPSEATTPPGGGGTPPAAPSNLAASAASDVRIDLTWSDSSSDESGFHVERSIDGSSFAQIASTGANVSSYSDTGVAASTTYYYRVRAHNGSGPSAYSNTASATTDPAAPADHTAIGEVSTSADVTGSYTDTWSNDAAYESLREQSTGGRPRTRSSLLEHEWTFDLTGAGAVTFFIKSYKSASSDGDDFTFELSTDGASYAQMLTVSRTDDDGSYQTYAVPASINGTVWVRVTDTDRTAGNSDRDRLYVDHMFFRPDDGTPPPDPTPPSAPSGLSATAASGSRIDVMWTDNASDEDGFEVERSPDGANWSGRAVLGADETTYSDAGLDSETTYYYRVRAYNIAGSSGFAGPASATTPAAGGAVDDVANSENHTYGAQTGTLQDTTAADGSYESIAERSSGGRRSDRYSRLDHDWTFDVSGGAQVTFFVKAYRSAPSDGDEFAFAYSTDGIGFTDVVTVTRTSDDGSYQSASLPSSLSGSVTIRVRDTDRTAGASSIDTIYVDHLFIRSE